MEETREQQRLYFFFQGLIYLYVCLEILMYTSFFSLSLPTFILEIADTVSRIPLFTHLLYSKVFTVVLVVLVSLGGRP